MATNTSQDIYTYPPKLLLRLPPPGERPHLFDTIDFFGSMFNTVIVAVVYDRPGAVLRLAGGLRLRQVRVPRQASSCSASLLRSSWLPTQLAVIPQFVIMVQIGWIGSLKALIVPAAANAFGIFWMRQYIESGVPDELLDAARIDGAGFFRQYWHVALPMSPPGPGLPRHLHLHRRLERLRPGP